MNDVISELTLSDAEKNFQHWSKELCCNHDGVDEREPAMHVLLTHTFPSRKVWSGADGVLCEKDLCGEILEAGKGLLSEHYRERNGYYLPGEPRPEMERARAVQLNKFVFAYLGVHDPAYSRRFDFGFEPAFGLFLRTGLEARAFPNCNATRRDLASKESSFLVDRRADFVTAEGARKLCRCETIQDRGRHRGDFWRYWGAIEFWEGDFADQHWHWKYEFHFHERIDVGDFDAVLWPEVGATFEGLGDGFTSLHDRAAGFQRKYPNCQIVFYEWDPLKPLTALVEASTAVAKYRLATGQLPSYAGDALARFGKAS